MRTTILMSALVLVALGAASCGGGGGGGDEAPQPVSVAFTLEEPTGPVDNSTLGNWDNTLLGVGEFGPAHQQLNNWRGIMTWDVSAIPQGATIVSATLEADQFAVNGAPYASLGQLLVDHIEMGPVMQGTAYEGFTVGGPAGLGIATLSTDASEGVKTTDVTAAVQRDVDEGIGMTQLRVRFQIPNNDDGEIDNIFIAGPESPDAARLVVEYLAP